MKSKAKYTYRIVKKHDIEYIELVDEQPGHQADAEEVKHVVEDICKMEHKDISKTRVIFKNSSVVWNLFNIHLSKLFQFRKKKVPLEDYEKFYHD